MVGQLTEKVVQWTESNVTAGYFIKEIQAESDRIDRLQGKVKPTQFQFLSSLFLVNPDKEGIWQKQIWICFFFYPQRWLRSRRTQNLCLRSSCFSTFSSVPKGEVSLKSIYYCIFSLFLSCENVWSPKFKSRFGSTEPKLVWVLNQG